MIEKQIPQNKKYSKTKLGKSIYETGNIIKYLHLTLRFGTIEKTMNFEYTRDLPPIKPQKSTSNFNIVKFPVGLILDVAVNKR